MDTDLRNRQEATDAIVQLEQVQPLKLTKEEMDEVEERILALPPEETGKSSGICFNMVLLKLQKGDLRGAKEWHNHLVNQRSGCPEGSEKRKMLENRIFCAGIAMSQNPSANLILNLSILAHEHGDARYPLARLSATNKTPSVLRGAKDLSFLSKHYRASASIVKPLLGALLEDDARGVCDVGIAEILYEQNDINGAALQAAGGFHVDNPEIVFAAFGLMARIGAVDPSAKQPEELLAHMEERLISQETRYLEPNFRALQARFAVLRGDGEAVRRWMDQWSVNELDSCIPYYYYQLISKCKGYLCLGEYQAAATLSESLILALQEGYRPLDSVECLVSNALACDLLGSAGTACKKLEKALVIAQEFGYIRVFADFGKPLHSLLARYRKENSLPEEVSSRYLDKISEAARIFGTLWPSLFGGQKEDRSSGEVEQITQAELDVLLLLERGKSNKDIAADLGISSNTVKFHLKNLYEKVNVSNRTELVAEAKNRGHLA